MASHTPSLAPVLGLRPDPGEGEDALDLLIDEGLNPVLDRLEESRRLHLSLSIDGGSLEQCQARAPRSVERLSILAKDGRLELLGGGFYDPVLSAIPIRDALGQIRLMAQLLHRITGRVPRGIWLPLAAWEPTLPALLQDAGCAYTVVAAGAFGAAGLAPSDCIGHWVTETEGRALAVFPGRWGSPGENSGTSIGEALDRWAQEPVKNAVSTLCLRASRREELSRAVDLLDALGGKVTTIRTQCLEQAHRREASRGRVHLPPWMQSEIASWTVRGGAEPPVGGAQSWQAFRSKYPVVHRLHRRMWWVSEKVDRLRQVVQSLQTQDPKGQTATNSRMVLQRACASLWQAQYHGYYWYAGALHQGFYGGGSNQAALSRLDAADAMAERILRDRNHSEGRCIRADVDLDGEEELVLRTCHLEAVVQPARGGGLWTLDLPSRGLHLQDFAGPVDEPLHDFASTTGICLVPEGEVEAGNDGLEALDEAAEEVLRALDVPDEGAATAEEVQEGATVGTERQAEALYWTPAPVGEGSVRRFGAFLDRFLAPETQVEAFALRQFRELGDFAGGRYEVLRRGGQRKEESTDPSGKAWVEIGRSGLVRDGGRAYLLRLERCMAIDPDHPRLTVTSRLVNRSREVATIRYGLEWSFAIPSGEAEGVVIRTQSEGESSEHLLASGPQDLGEHLGLEWEDRKAELRLFFEFSAPAQVWWVPISTEHEGPEGPVRQLRGNALLLCTPVELWGEDRHEITVKVSVLGDAE